MRVQPTSVAKAFGAVLVVAAGAWTYEITREDGARIAFLAVGQGDATVFQHEGRTMLIDCGPALEGYDAGERLVAPKLYGMGVRTLDLLILTHPDGDHTGGLRALARRFRIGRVVVNAAFRGHAGMRETLSAARIDGRSVVWVSGRAWVRWGGWTIRVHAPAPSGPADDNARSLFVHVSGERSSVLLTGDAPTEVEEAMVGQAGPWEAQVLKAGHHGSAHSTGARMLAVVRPRDVVVSCGRNNVYGHPSPDVLARIRFAGARVARTDREGDLVFEPSPSGFRRVPAGRRSAGP